MYYLLNLYKEYSDYSTIAGLLYIFMPDQTLFGKLYWIIAILLVNNFYIFTFFAMHIHNYDLFVLLFLLEIKKTSYSK